MFRVKIVSEEVICFQALRNKAYGKAIDFVWSSEGHYAVRSEGGQITIFHSFKVLVDSASLDVCVVVTYNSSA